MQGDACRATHAGRRMRRPYGKPKSADINVGARHASPKVRAHGHKPGHTACLAQAAGVKVVVASAEFKRRQARRLPPVVQD